MRLGTALGCVKQVSLLWRESSRVALRTRESERLWVCTTSSAPTIDGIAEGLTWCSTPINMGHFRAGWYHTCYRMNESDTGKIHFSNVLKKKKESSFLQMESFRNWWKNIDTKFNQWLIYIYIYVHVCTFRFILKNWCCNLSIKMSIDLKLECHQRFCYTSKTTWSNQSSYSM